MKLYGLTGGIGMGKSVAYAFLRERAVAALDTDLISREVVKPGQPALAEIVAAYGSSLLDGKGALKREVHASIVFSDAAKLKQLEAILHPRIRSVWQNQVEQWRAQGVPCAVVVIPLLFETDAQKSFDKVVCVACSKATQHERLKTRGWTDEQIQKRIGAQMPVERKMELSHHVIWSEGSLGAHQRQLKHIFI